MNLQIANPFLGLYNPYQYSKIYKITSPSSPSCYIGSTTLSLHTRHMMHKNSHNAFTRWKGQYMTSYDIIKHNDSIITLVEEFPCMTRSQLSIQEGIHIRNTPNCVNKNISGRTMSQYYIDKRQHIREQQRQYYANKNKKKITV